MSRPAREFELADALLHARAVCEQAERALAEARRKLRETRLRRQAIAGKLTAIDQQRAICGAIDATALAAHAAYRGHVQQRLREAKQAVALTEHEVQQRVRALSEARQRVEALEALEARQRRAWSRWKTQREQDAADELAATRGAARRRADAE